MKVEEIKIIKNVSAEKNRKGFSWESFIEAFGEYSLRLFLSVTISLIPIILIKVLSFIENNDVKFSFFANIEITYICVMLSIIMVLDTLFSKRKNLLSYSISVIGMVVVIFCSLIYGYLVYTKYKNGGFINIDELKFSTVNLYLFLFTMSFALISYIVLSFKSGKEG